MIKRGFVSPDYRELVSQVLVRFLAKFHGHGILDLIQQRLAKTDEKPTQIRSWYG